MRLTYNRLLVTDFRAAFLFYRDVLGLTPTFGTEDDVYADFEAGGTTIALFRRDFMEQAIGAPVSPADATGPDKIALIFEVENVDETYADLQSKGVQFLTAPQDRKEWGIRPAHFRDPDGNLLEIYSPLKA
jgi:catechol 2,3-dioxygenase-like lactoylglutathione lyase family enzyme